MVFDTLSRHVIVSPVPGVCQPNLEGTSFKSGIGDAVIGQSGRPPTGRGFGPSFGHLRYRRGRRYGAAMMRMVGVISPIEGTVTMRRNSPFATVEAID